MTYKNWKMHTSQLPRKQKEYSEVANWCRESKAYKIVQKSDFYCVEEITPPPPLTKEQIAKERELYRKSTIDSMTLQRIRKLANNTWTAEDETEYLALDASVSAWLDKNYPYPEETHEQLLV